MELGPFQDGGQDRHHFISVNRVTQQMEGKGIRYR